METAKHYSNWEIGDKYELIKFLGQGAYSIVALARRKADGKEVAIKRINKLYDSLTDTRRILREIILLRLLSNPGVCALVEII